MNKELLLPAATKEDIKRIYNSKSIKEIKSLIESKYPELLQTPVETAILEVGERVFGKKVLHMVENEESYVLVPLPNTNRQWTFDAFDYVKRFVEMYPESYPVHGVQAMVEKYIGNSGSHNYLVIKFVWY